MGFIDKVYKVAKIADITQRLSSVASVDSLTKGLNLGSFDINNLGSIGGNIEGMISGKVSEITGGLENSIDVSQIQNLASEVTPADVGIDMSSIETGIEGLDLNKLGINLNGLSFM